MPKKKDGTASSAKDAAPVANTQENLTSVSKVEPGNWRGVMPIHPAAELFPLMAPDELKELAEDIKKNGGPNERIKLWRAGPDAPWQLLDGRNRLDALALVPMEMTLANIEAYSEMLDSSVDPYAYVISANIKRRHLNVEQRQKLLISLIAREPEKSNRQIGREIGVDHKTVAAARAEGEDVGNIPHIETRIDSIGRNQPARKGGKKSGKKSGKKGVAARAKDAETDNVVKLQPDPEPSERERDDEIARSNANEEIAIAAAFATLISLGRTLQLGDLPKDASPSDLLELAERIRQLAAEREAMRAEETVH